MTGTLAGWRAADKRIDWTHAAPLFDRSYRGGIAAGLQDTVIRQLVYVSRAAQPGDRAMLDRIYEQSRHNNAIDGVTGLLFSDGRRFIQVLEGGDQAITATMDRIRRDPRHEHLTILHDARVEAAEFGQWSMADQRRGEGADEFDARLRQLLARTSPDVRDAFFDLLQTS